MARGRCLGDRERVDTHGGEDNAADSGDNLRSGDAAAACSADREVQDAEIWRYAQHVS